MNTIIYAGKHLASRNVPPHAHSYWEFVYYTSGSVRFHFEDQEFACAAGDIVAIPPMTMHAISSEEGFSALHINLTELALTSRKPIVLHDDSNRFLLQIFNAAYCHFNGCQEHRDVLLPPYGDLLCSYLEAFRKPRPISKVVEDIEASIIANFPDCDYELDKYLQSFPFSYDYLRKLFKKELGITPHKYLNDKRLQTAADMLTYGYTGSANIADISQLCGFREPLYFSRMFKKKFGVAPSYYLEMRRKELSEKNG